MSIRKDWLNRKVVGERKVKLLDLRVKERPDQVLNAMRDGEAGFSVPVHVICKLEVDGVMCLWPVNPQQQTAGMWFKSMDEWEQDEDRFKELLSKEMDRLAILHVEKNDNITGY